jgi:NAD-dependent dihydropyrimidine dehydrogenase PreA subunit
MPPVISREKCIPCAVCVNVCPEDVFFGSEPKEVPKVLYPEECYHCAACVTDCPTEAIDLFLPLPLRL